MESAVARRTDDDGMTEACCATPNLCVLKVLLDGAKACEDDASRKKESVDDFIWIFMLYVCVCACVCSNGIENYETVVTLQELRDVESSWMCWCQGVNDESP